MGNDQASGVVRQRLRLSVGVVLSGLSAALIAALAVATNLATSLIPSTWSWARDASVMWGLTALLAVSVVLVAVLMQRVSGGAATESLAYGSPQIRSQDGSIALAKNTGTVINAPASVLYVNTDGAPLPSKRKASTSKSSRKSDAECTMPARPQNATAGLAFPRIESIEDSLGNRAVRRDDHLGINTGVDLWPGRQLTFAVEASDPEGADVALRVITPAGSDADVDVRPGKITWNVGVRDIADPAHIHIYVASLREYHRVGSANFDDAATFTYRILPGEPQPEERRFVDVTVEYLAGLCEGLTSLQAEKLTDAFIGKWLKVSGFLGNVGPFSGSSSRVVFETEGDHPRPVMYFTNRIYAEDRLATLRKGDRLTIVGKIDVIDRFRVELTNCELVDGDEQGPLSEWTIPI